MFFWGLLPAAGGYSLRSSNCALKGLLSLWGSQVCSALRQQAGSVWPDGHPAASLGQSLRSFAAAAPPAIWAFRLKPTATKEAMLTAIKMGRRLKPSAHIIYSKQGL